MKRRHTLTTKPAKKRRPAARKTVTPKRPRRRVYNPLVIDKWIDLPGGRHQVRVRKVGRRHAVEYRKAK